MSATAKDCSACQKSSLSLLLLRPSPVAKESVLQAPGSSAAAADAALVQHLIPEGLTESRPALRLLRAGYVHLYIPSKNQWLSYSVTSHGDVLSEKHPSFGNPELKTCRRDGHNAAGFKLLQLPNAHELIGKSIWLAFSANVWSDTLKARNKANPKAMVEVKLGSTGTPGFKPDAASLKRQVLECNVLSWHLPKLQAPVAPAFAFNSMAYAPQVQALADTLTQAAARHPKTAGHELAVVLPDPVGYAAELNALRLARFEWAKQDLAKPENKHPVASLQMLEGLRQGVADEQESNSFEAVSPIMQKRRFDMSLRRMGGHLPDDARWLPFNQAYQQRKVVRTNDERWGRVVFTDHEARARHWAASATESTWRRWGKYIDEDRLKTWKDSFDKKMQAAHGEPQKRFEADWSKARQHEGYAQYLLLHFDDMAPNAVGSAQSHCSGTTYSREVVHSSVPQPLVRGEAFDSYLAELRKSPTDSTAYMQRALAGNQSSVLKALQEYAQGAQGPNDAAGNPRFAANQEESSRSDKLHDLAAGLLQRADANAVLGLHHLKYSWLLHASYGVNTLLIAQSLGAAWAASLAVVGGKGPVGDALSGKLERLLMGTQQILLARESAIKNTLLEVPMRVTVRLEGAQTKAHFLARQAAGADTPSARATNRMLGQQGGWVDLTLVTTNHELAKVGYDPKAAVAAGVGSVALGTGGNAAMLQAPKVIILSETALATLMQRQATLWEKAANTLRDMGQGLRGASLSLDGHIGLVALLLNGMSVWGSAKDTFASNDTAKWLAFADSSAGAIGGLAQVTQSAFSASVATRAGQAAAEKSLWVMGAGVVASGAGAFGGIATAAGLFVKATKSFSTGNNTATSLYTLSGMSFVGQSTTSLVQFIGAFSDFMVAKGSQRVIWDTGSRFAASAAKGVALRTGGRIVGGAVVGGLSLTGLGLIFLAAGLIFEAGVLLLTPDALQRHIQNSYFGKGGNEADKYKTLEEEEQGVQLLTQPPLSAEPPEQLPFADPMTGWMMGP